ncbi:LuxR C-terminal-related transcriptional regulator [Dictyobacter formicarum]|uniref:HTH-type transcriptional regulator MalT n=1 Tax=Dictyobacter formicarum TaxID=2778368 RepID=A0ABQ3VJV5_9CHLR|nr:LuxR C-terminal-related transcriptional regulator [Dictyobacter formicarum]GHO86365.1 HTH-type transcriptional regulator MalT [Dictyobacter formicarum]
MPKSARYKVSWSEERTAYVLTGPAADDALPSLTGDGQQWLAWLEGQRAFAFYGRHGQLNLLKEKRTRGRDGYWYAYQRHGAKMVKRYVGASTQLSMERMETIAELLTHGEQETTLARAPQLESLLLPKLQLPLLPKSLIARPQLLALLDKSLDYKLTFISGSAGYGKTTTVGQWIAHHTHTHPAPFGLTSLVLDESDNDPVRFWHYIIAACQKLRADVGREALELLQAHRLPPFKPLEMMLTTLLNELSQLEQPCTLVLDDFHVIHSAQVIASLNFFLDHLPTSFHLIILMRGDLPFNAARLRARNELLDIYPPDLNFSLEETKAFFEQELPFVLSPKLLRQIYARIEGWPTGLRLLTRALRRSEYHQEEAEQLLAHVAGSYWNVQEYFLNEILHTLSPELQTFLLQTCILPRVTATLCDVITERQDSARLLETLRAGDLFLIPLDGIGEWARYLPLFAEAMQQEARRRLGDEQLRQLMARASLWYEEHAFVVEAIDMALNAEIPIRAARLIERFLEEKRQANIPTIPDYYRLCHWLGRLPASELESHPELCLNYALALLFISYEEAIAPDRQEYIHQLLRLAEQYWRDVNDTAKLAEVFALRALQARKEGKLLQAVTWAKQSLAWLPQEDQLWRNLSLTVVGMGEAFDGHLERAYDFLFEAQLLSEQQHNLTYVRAAIGMLSWVVFEQGKLLLASEQYLQMQRQARLYEDYDDIAHTQLALAQIAYQWNRLDEAEQAVDEVLEIGERMHVEEFEARAVLSLALIEQARGQYSQAQQRLTAWLARRPVFSSPFSYQLTRLVQAVQARIQLAAGDLAAVKHWLNSIERRSANIPLLQRQREQLLQLRLQLAEGEVTAAIGQLEYLAASAQETGHTYFWLEVQVVLVLAYARQGAYARAHEQLHQVLRSTYTESYVRLFLDEGEELAHLLRHCASHLHEKGLHAYVLRLLNAFAQESESEMAVNALAPQEILSSQEQKVLRLLAAGNSNAEIASELVVSVNTIRSQVQSIYRKLNVNNRVEASSVASQLNFL